MEINRLEKFNYLCNIHIFKTRIGYRIESGVRVACVTKAQIFIESCNL